MSNFLILAQFRNLMRQIKFLLKETPSIFADDHCKSFSAQYLGNTVRMNGHVISRADIYAVLEMR